MGRYMLYGAHKMVFISCISEKKVFFSQFFLYK